MNAVTAQICATCGTKLLPNDRFCSGCGSRVGGGEESPAPRVDPLLERLRRITLGLYDVHSELGRGGMAAVYLAHDLRLDRKVAIKVMLPELFMSEGMADRFLLEARTAARLSHPNIVIIHAVSNVDELFYFVMNLVEGAAIDDVLKSQRPLPVDESKWILSQAARALQHAHQEGVVHRDVKPANIMCNVRGDIVLTDFGIAKATESQHLTRTGSAVGTPAYMSPEQVLAIEITGASDQYALGIVAYELLSGKPPFRGSALEVQWAHAHHQPPDLAAAAPELPTELSDAIMRMLAKKPEERWESLEPLIDIFSEGLPASGGRARQSLAARAQAAQSTRTAGLSPTPQSPLPAISKVAPAQRRPGPTSKELPAEPRPVSGQAPAVPRPVSGQAPAVPRPVSGQAPAVPRPVSGQAPVVPRQASGQTPVVPRPTGETPVAPRPTATPAPTPTPAPEPAPHPFADEEELPQDIEVGQTVTLGIDASEHDGPVRFVSSNSAILEVDDAGTVRAVSAGTASVLVIVGDQTTEVHFEVSPRPRQATHLTITPSTAEIEVGESLSLAVSAHDDDPAMEFPIDDAMVWRSDRPDVVTCSPSGVLSAIARGGATIYAQAGALSGSCEVVVTAPTVARLTAAESAIALIVRDSAMVVVTAFDRRGAVVDDARIEFTSSNESVLRVDDDGTATALTPGRASIRMRSGTATAVIDVTVTAIPVAAIRVSESSLAMETGDVAKLTAQTVDADGDELVGRPLTWQSTNADVARVSSNSSNGASVTAVAPGRTTLIVSSGTVRAQIDVAVTAIPLRELSLTPNEVTALVGKKVTLTARAIDARGKQAPAEGLTWSVQHANIASVADGVLQARAAGTTTVTARLGSLNASARVVVTAPVAKSVVVSGPSRALSVGSKGSASAQVRDSEGAAMDGAAAAVKWESSAPTIASVDANGAITALAVGRATITARAGTLSGTTQIDVQEAKKLPVKLLAGVGGVVVVGVVAAVMMSKGSGGSTPTVDQAAIGNTSGAPATPGTVEPSPTAGPTPPNEGKTAQTSTVAPAAGASSEPTYSGVIIKIDNAPATSIPTLNLKQATSLTISAVAKGIGSTKDSTLIVQSMGPSVARVDRGRIVPVGPGVTELVASIGALEKRLKVMVVSEPTSTASAQTTPVTPTKPEEPPKQQAAPVPEPVRPDPVRTEPAPTPPRREEPEADRPMSAPDFVSWTQSWLGEKGQGLADALSPPNDELRTRLKKYDRAKFMEEGGLQLVSSKVSGNGGVATVSFPSKQSSGIPGTVTIKLQVNYKGRTVASAQMIGGFDFKAK
jgi:serine/threonine protein kinase